MSGSVADEITVSAPDERVDLEALKRPRLGGKEPSDDDYSGLPEFLAFEAAGFNEFKQ